ncbi:phage holin family protein [Clostridium pasteurianum]|uniref:Toxin secretion/phage lysis holin n=1 Tax=Clostridium pasteurianum BC1 TaxID=86416 RepID=R4K1J8_CLOPA|nr:phage holin family protein [Clostridium pasteurianum]AGK95641.1 toxin secretion/phage lysis holin [Clostridium pasteurianum BC1]
MKRQLLGDNPLFNGMVAGIGGIFTYILGGWDTPLTVLFWFMGIDYMTGLLGAIAQHKLNSKTSYRGIAKKLSILIIVTVAVLLDRLINNDVWVFRTFVCYFYIANEGISILENVGKTGVPLPQKLINVLEQLKKEEE